jgi:hypothetical protein
VRRFALPLAVTVVAVLIVAGLLYGIGRVAGVGPFAPGVPASWLFLAISRGGEEGDAREIEVIDLVTGERPPLFPLDDRAFDLALSRDRRTLYVGTTNARVFELDAQRGVFLGEIKLAGGGDVRRLLVLPDGGRLLAVVAGATDASAALVDLGARRETGRLSLGNRIIGQSVAGRDVVLATSDRGRVEQLLTLDLDPLRVRDELILSSLDVPSAPRTAAPSLRLARDGSIVALSPFALRLTAVAIGSGERRSADIPTSGIRAGAPFPGFDADLTLANGDAVVHFCVGTSQRAERFVAPRETLRGERVGTECGRYASLRDGSVYLAVRGKPELRELDPTTGVSRRTLALAGFAQRVAY